MDDKIDKEEVEDNDKEMDDNVGARIVNCPTQPTCIAHCVLCICQLYLITNPQ